MDKWLWKKLDWVGLMKCGWLMWVGFGCDVIDCGWWNV